MCTSKLRYIIYQIGWLIKNYFGKYICMFIGHTNSIKPSIICGRCYKILDAN